MKQRHRRAPTRASGLPGSDTASHESVRGFNARATTDAGLRTRRGRAPAVRQQRGPQGSGPGDRRDGRSQLPAFLRRRVRAAARGGTDPRPRFRPARGVPAVLGRAPHLAKRTHLADRTEHHETLRLERLLYSRDRSDLGSVVVSGSRRMRPRRSVRCGDDQPPRPRHQSDERRAIHRMRHRARLRQLQAARHDPRRRRAPATPTRSG
jgi:hypothetical protein